MRRFITYGLILVLGSACEKWYTTEDVSHISELPEIILEGGEFVSFVRNDTLEYTDPGASAFSNGKELTVHAFGMPDLSKVGVYLIRYYAENADDLFYITDRVIAVTYEDVTHNDLSGTYEGTNWETVESRVKKVHLQGLYECQEVLGYYDLEMPGRFVDLGNNELVLLNGQGYFGRYAASEGNYTLSTLSWTVSLIDPPNEGIEIEVLWRKKL
jgi:hypothetical protein